MTASDAEMNNCRAAIVDARAGIDGSTLKVLRVEVPRCLDHGLRVLALIDASDIPQLRSFLGAYIGRFQEVDATRSSDDLAEEAREMEVISIPPHNPKLDLSALKLSAADEFLLKRAFHDCELLAAELITEGKSTAKVLRVHAQLGDRMPKAFGLPYLVKIDAVGSIRSEIENYRLYVDGYVPFSQRPHLDSRRCILGAERGVLVGDFVDDAVSLASVCDKPQGHFVIYSLFDDALRAWRRHAYSDAPTATDTLDDLIEGLVRTGEINPAIVTRAQSFGLRASPADIEARLKALTTNWQYRRGIIHGDLHPGNVMVRGMEAILIDFASIWPKAALVADLACLEVAAVFTVASANVVRGVTSVKRNPFKSWKSEVDKLYGGDCVRQVPPLLAAPGRHSWLWSLCRQVRSMAPQVGCDAQRYAGALVVYMLRRARLGSNPGESIPIAAYALRTAEKILVAAEAGDYL